METFTEFKPMVADPRYPDRRKKCLDELNFDELDAPVEGNHSQVSAKDLIERRMRIWAILG